MQKSKMSVSERAKIFAPFDALKGFREMLKEEERVKEAKKELSQDMIDDLDNVLNSLKLGMMIEVIFYDSKEEKYKSLIGVFTKIDTVYKKLVVVKTRISIDDILSVKILSEEF